MVDEVSHWSLTARALTQTPVSSFGTYSQQSGTGTAVSPKYYGFCLSIIFPPILHTQSSITDGI